MDTHSIAAAGLAATVNADGAELVSLTGPGGHQFRGHQFLWQALPAWPRHAPVLFPIVGRLRDDRLRHAGREYRMTQHGFARDRRFAWVERTPAACRLALTDDAASREIYPFAFRFELAFAIADRRLTVTYTLTNTGHGVLPAAMGAHPAFAWPLLPGLAKTAHRLEFAAAEPNPIRRVAGGLLLAETFPTPIEGRVLHLREDLFAADAIILDRPASRALRYTAPGAPALTIAWEGFPELGIWMRPGADFLCIEPWHGMASPVDFDGEFTDKPGLMLIPEGERRTASYSVGVA